MASSVFYTNWSVPASGYLNWGTVSGSTGYGLRDNAGTIEFQNSGGTWAPIAASASSAGGWTKTGAVVSLTTGTDTLGANLRPTDATYTLGDITHRWNNAFFASGGGVSFSGVAAPITMVGGDDGASDTLLTIDNPTDGYVAIKFPSYTDVLADNILNFASTDLLNFVTVDPATGVQIGAEIATNKKIRLLGNVEVVGSYFLNASMVGAASPGGTLTIFPSTDKTSNIFQLQNFIHAGDVDYNEIHTTLYAQTDHLSDKFEAVHAQGGSNGSTAVGITAYGVEGHYTALGVLSDWHSYFYDLVGSRELYGITSAAPNTFQFGAGISVSVPGTVTAATIIPTTSYKSVDGSTGATGTVTGASTVTVKNGLITNIA